MTSVFDTFTDDEASGLKRCLSANALVSESSKIICSNLVLFYWRDMAKCRPISDDPQIQPWSSVVAVVTTTGWSYKFGPACIKSRIIHPFKGQIKNNVLAPTMTHVSPAHMMLHSVSKKTKNKVKESKNRSVSWCWNRWGRGTVRSQLLPTDRGSDSGDVIFLQAPCVDSAQTKVVQWLWQRKSTKFPSLKKMFFRLFF